MISIAQLQLYRELRTRCGAVANGEHGKQNGHHVIHRREESELELQKGKRVATRCEINVQCSD